MKNFSLVWQDKFSVRLSVHPTRLRETLKRYFWSANTVNFDSAQMSDPNWDWGKPQGQFGIIRYRKRGPLRQGFLVGRQAWTAAGVIGAMHFGVRFPDVVRKHKQVLAVGSFGPASGVPDCDLHKFCPTLFG